MFLPFKVKSRHLHISPLAVTGWQAVERGQRRGLQIGLSWEPGKGSPVGKRVPGTPCPRLGKNTLLFRLEVSCEGLSHLVECQVLCLYAGRSELRSCLWPNCPGRPTLAIHSLSTYLLLDVPNTALSTAEPEGGLPALPTQGPPSHKPGNSEHGNNGFDFLPPSPDPHGMRAPITLCHS